MKTRIVVLFMSLVLLGSFIPIGSPVTADALQTVQQNTSVMFIENVGQFPEDARFRAFGGQYNLWLAEDVLWFVLVEPSSKVSQPEDRFRKYDRFLRIDEEEPRLGVAVKLTFPGANPNPPLEPFTRLDTVVSYFIGNEPAKWHPDVPVWGGVRYRELYPGVDLEVTSESGRWTWQMIARDGADLSAVSLRVEGAQNLAMDGNYLNLTTAVGNFTLPLLTADWPGPSAAIAGHEVLHPFTSPTKHPPIKPQDNPDDLLYSTFLGGGDLDRGFDVAVDSRGAAYITGLTFSLDFPATPGAFDTAFNSSWDTFVAKLNPSGGTLIYATFLGGSSFDEGRGIAVDGSGAAYVAGITGSSDFPTTLGAFDTIFNGNYDAFVVKVNIEGSSLSYATYLGGRGGDCGEGIALDKSGAAYVAGYTWSSDFPTTAGAFDTTYNEGGYDAFVIKLNSAGTTPVYASFLGGSNRDDGWDIAVDERNAAYITGWTWSSDFPTTAGAFDTTFNGGIDIFIVKVNVAGNALSYSTFLGGSSNEGQSAIDVDGDGATYVTGVTLSSDFPTTPGAFDTNFHSDTFVVKLDPTGSSLIYGTFLGGSYIDYGDDIVVNQNGLACVTGKTTSFDFPTTQDAFDTTCGTDGSCDYDGGYRWDVFVARLNATGSALSYSTFLGGSGNDWESTLAVDGSGSAYVTGWTDSPDFPTTLGALDTTYNGGYDDAFLAKLAMGGGGPGPTPTPEPPTPTKSPVVLVHGWQALGTKTRRCSDGIKRLAPGVSHTFGEMAQWFVNAGYDVWIANLDSGPLYTPTIEENAQCLKSQISSVRQQTGQKVILVAHSMGGLVSRACLSLDDCRDNVAAFYTLGSPHAGVNSAFLLKLLAHFKAPIAEELVCEWQPALCQFSTDGMVWFNLFNPNRYGVGYSFIGGTKTPFPLGWLLLPFDGPNDGVVGSYSAVGWLYPTKLNAVRGPEAGRYWTNEAHTRGVGSPTYFEASGGRPESEAFRCIARGECTEANTLALSAAQTEPALSATTVDVVGHLASGQSGSHTLEVDTSDHSLFYLSWLTGTLAFTLTNPVGTVIDPVYATANADVVTYTTSPGSEMTFPFAVYAFTSTVPGLYTVTIAAGDVGITGTDYFLFAALETTRTFSVSTDANLYQVGQTATFTGTLQGPFGGISGATVQVTLIPSDGVTETLLFNDLGSGVYTATWTIPDAPGYLQATFRAVGDDHGMAFTRQIDKLLAIAPYTAQLADSYTDRPEDEDGDGFDDILVLDVGVTATQVGTYTLSADLAAEGRIVAHAVEYTILATGIQTVTLGFDGWDIWRSRVDGPYTITHISLVDLGVGSIPAQMAEDVWVTGPYKWRDFGFERLYLPLIMRNH